MEFITGRHISRREILRGLGATVALPFLREGVVVRRLLPTKPVWWRLRWYTGRLAVTTTVPPETGGPLRLSAIILI